VAAGSMMTARVEVEVLPQVTDGRRVDDAFCQSSEESSGQRHAATALRLV